MGRRLRRRPVACLTAQLIVLEGATAINARRDLQHALRQTAQTVRPSISVTGTPSKSVLTLKRRMKDVKGEASARAQVCVNALQASQLVFKRQVVQERSVRSDDERELLIELEGSIPPSESSA